jgi:stage V sporulation protein SpoVS
MIKRGYVASEPIDLMYLTSLKLGKLEELSKPDSSRIDIIKKLLHDRDTQIATNAQLVLLSLTNSLTNQTDINHLCSLWADGRDKRLENIMIKRGYVASEPIDLMYLTSLKLGKLEELLPVGRWQR